MRPPTFETAFEADDAALLRAGPAELVTLERPSCALETVLWAVSFAAVAALEAVCVASDVVDAARRWTTSRDDCRRASRGRRGDAMAVCEEM